MFTNIQPITVDLKKSTLTLNRKETEVRTKALIKNRKTSSITASTAEALEIDANVQLYNTIHLIYYKSVLGVRTSYKD